MEVSTSTQKIIPDPTRFNRSLIYRIRNQMLLGICGQLQTHTFRSHYFEWREKTGLLFLPRASLRYKKKSFCISYKHGHCNRNGLSLVSFMKMLTCRKKMIINLALNNEEKKQKKGFSLISKLDLRIILGLKQSISHWNEVLFIGTFDKPKTNITVVIVKACSQIDSHKSPWGFYVYLNERKTYVRQISCRKQRQRGREKTWGGDNRQHWESFPGKGNVQNWSRWWV